MDTLESFYLALEKAVEREGNVNRLAKAAGIPFMSIKRWLDRSCVPNLEGVISLLPYIDWPERDKATMKGMGGNAEPQVVSGNDLVRIPVALEAGAGSPLDIVDTDPKYIEVLPRFAKPNVRAVEVVGDSMEPTIGDGAIVGVLPFNGTLREGGIYMCHLQYFGYVIKRVRAHGTKGITLISDNKAYEPIEVAPEDCQELIIGEVDWCWQRV